MRFIDWLEGAMDHAEHAGLKFIPIDFLRKKIADDRLDQAADKITPPWTIAAPQIHVTTSDSYNDPDKIAQDIRDRIIEHIDQAKRHATLVPTVKKESWVGIP